MSLLDMLWTVLIGPLKLIFEVIFSVAYTVTQHPGPSVIVLSLAMNILVLPLYKRADEIQIAARDTENKLKDTVAHIKKTFSGDERMMILQTYYRQNNYNPLSVLSGSLSLLLEIPFFMAAYQFLSGVSAFSGVSFGPIKDLSVPDGLLSVGGLTINLLPVIMTLINVISSSLYLKGFPLKTKIQLYGMALFFLVFLYNSPAALVFYWTLNNTFSLFKTLFFKLKDPKAALKVLLGVCGLALIALGICLNGFWKTLFFIGLGLIIQLYWIIPLIKKPSPVKKAPAPSQNKPNKSLFIAGALFLTLLIGLLIPSTYISASPQEYIDIFCFYDPVWFVVNSLCLSIGTFLVWTGVFYWLSPDSAKAIFARVVGILSIVMTVNYMFFGTNLGIISPDLQYTDGFFFEMTEQIINLAVVAAVFAALWFVIKRYKKAITAVLLTASVALAGMGGINLVGISKASADTRLQLGSSGDSFPSFSLSKNGQNVVVFMLDRGIAQFVPYIMEENPELKKQFDGFTFYSNTLSYGAFTNFAAPALYGGYDYTPENLNKRDDELLADKHNEALKVLPTIFSKEDYAVSVIDPSYAGYKTIPDLSIYNDMEGVNAYRAEGRFDDFETKLSTIDSRKRNFFLFSLMKTLPVSMQKLVYNDGLYRALPADNTDGSNAEVSSVFAAFMMAYNAMANLESMTSISQGSENTFMFLRSNITHEPVILQEPSYTPNPGIASDYPESGKTITDGTNTIRLDNTYKVSHYHVNMAALMQLGEWFDHLRENGVYDNTRIIIVSDHGRNLGITCPSEDKMKDVEFYQAMLLVKDFNQKGFTVSDEFMTNADVPSLAAQGLIDSPVNPFTGNPLYDSQKAEGEKHWIIVSDLWDVKTNNKNQFIASRWASFSGNVNDSDCYTFYEETTVLPPEAK